MMGQGFGEAIGRSIGRLFIAVIVVIAVAVGTLCFLVGRATACPPPPCPCWNDADNPGCPHTYEPGHEPRKDEASSPVPSDSSPQPVEPEEVTTEEMVV